jgi:hypothetical protein
MAAPGHPQARYRSKWKVMPKSSLYLALQFSICLIKYNDALDCRAPAKAN